MPDLDNHIFYFVRHPVYAGGNHVANVISLDPTFSTRWNTSRDVYLEQLIEIYNKNIPWVHVPDECAVGSGNWLEESFIDPFCQHSVHRTHVATYSWEKASIDKLKNKRHVLLTFNNQRSVDLLRLRERSHNGNDTLAYYYYWQELAFFYNQLVEEPEVDSRETNLKIEVEDIFESDPEPWIQSINQHFGLTIPIEPAKTLHQIWINKNSTKEIT